MDRLFRYTLRLGALALLGVGVAMVVYSMQTGGGTSSPGNTRDSANEQTPGGIAVPADTRLQGTARLDFFKHPVVQEDERVIRLAGPTAYLDREKKIYTVVEPELSSYDITSGTEVQNAGLTARGAVWRETAGVVELEGQVVAGGQDFQVETSSVIFNVTERTLTTDSEVRITAFGTDENGERVPVMHTVSQGMAADLVLSRIELRKLVTTTIYAAAADMFADDTPAQEQQEQDSNLVITCHGPAIYEHAARTVTYQEKVRANSGTKVLACRSLTIQLEEVAPSASLGQADNPAEEPPEQQPRMTLSKVSAEGEVELRATMDDTTLLARGEKLDWQNLAQIITLTGRPAEVDTDAFHAEGQEVRIVRMTAGYRVDGKGALVWKPAGGAGAEPDNTTDQWQPVPLKLEKTAPTRVSWEDSMNYDTATNAASFTGGVEVSQAGLTMACEKLSLRFNRNEETADGDSPLEPAGVVAEGDVLVQAGQREVACQKLEWDAETGAIELKAAEDRRLTFSEGPMTIHSRAIHVDNANQRFKAPGAGRLIVEPEPPEEGEKPREPLIVTWDGEALLQQGDEPYARFSGGVKAVSGLHRLEGKTVRVDLAEGTTPTRITVTEDAVIDVTTRQRQTATEATGASPVAGADRWRLTGEQYLLNTVNDSVVTKHPGILTMFSGDTLQGTLSWDEAMDLDMSKNAATFTGDVVAKTTAGNVMGRKLSMQFGVNQETGRRTIKQIGLDGEVQFKGIGERGLELSADSALAIFGAGSRLSQLVAHDDIKLSDRARTMTAGRLVLKFDEVKDDEGVESLQVVNASAEEEVRISYDEKDITAGASRVDWNRKIDSYTLTGNPAWIMRGGLRSQGKTLTYYGPTGQPR